MSLSLRSLLNTGANENLSCGFPSIPRIAPGVALRIVVFVLLKSWEAIPRMELRIPRISFRIPRAALRIPQSSPRAPRMAFSLLERFSWNWGGPQASDTCLTHKLFEKAVSQPHDNQPVHQKKMFPRIFDLFSSVFFRLSRHLSPQTGT